MVIPLLESVMDYPLKEFLLLYFYQYLSVLPFSTMIVVETTLKSFSWMLKYAPIEF